MTLFSLLSQGIGKRIGDRLHQLLQQRPAILEQRGSQAQLDGFQIVGALLCPLPADQGYEGLGFLESFFLALLRFEPFFLLSSAAHSNRVI